MTLADRIYTVLIREPAVGDDTPLEAAGTYPARPADECLTPFELDCRDWGFVFGIAYGIARGDDPWEPDEEVLARAHAAAREAFQRWGGSDIFTDEAFTRDRATRPVPNEIEAVA